MLAIAAAMVLGLIVALAALSKRKLLTLPAGAFVQCMRNTPLLVQLYLVYFGLGMIGIPLSAFLSGLIALAAQNGAYIAEIYRGGLQSISRTQIEAGRARSWGSARRTSRVGRTAQAFMRVVPPLCNQFIQIIKDTSISARIAVGELMHQGKMLSERTAVDLRNLRHGRRALPGDHLSSLPRDAAVRASVRDRALGPPRCCPRS